MHTIEATPLHRMFNLLWHRCKYSDHEVRGCVEWLYTVFIKLTKFARGLDEIKQTSKKVEGSKKQDLITWQAYCNKYMNMCYKMHLEHPEKYALPQDILREKKFMWVTILNQLGGDELPTLRNFENGTAVLLVELKSHLLNMSKVLKQQEKNDENTKWGLFNTFSATSYHEMKQFILFEFIGRSAKSYRSKGKKSLTYYQDMIQKCYDMLHQDS